MDIQATLDQPLLGNAGAADTWYIAFLDYQRKRWWEHIGTQPGFRHVALARVVSDHLLLLNWRFSTTDLMVIPKTIFFHWVGRNSGTVLQYQRGPMIRTWPICHLLTCVTTACHSLHLPLCLTPRQLYRALIQRGATVVFVSSRESQKYGDGAGSTKAVKAGTPTGESR